MHEPEVPDELEYVVEAFFVLGLSRPIGLGIGAIPLTEIRAYLALMPVAHDDDVFSRLIITMDDAWRGKLAILKTRKPQDGKHSEART